jgi:peptide/nickel transport system permease protein
MNILTNSLRWFGSAIALILGVIVLMFFLLELTPGDPIQALVGNMPVTPELREQLTVQFGLDRPMVERLFIYIGNILTGDLGYSYANRSPIAPLLFAKLGNTLLLVVPALILSSALGILLGALAAITRSKSLDNVLSISAIAGFSVPSFWLGLVAIIVFAVQLRWLPAQGMRSYTSTGLSIPHLVLPVLTMTITELAFKLRLMRATMIEVLGQDYIDTARSKGLSRAAILRKHALLNSMLPMITVIGYSIGYTLSGTVLIEKVFGWPGMGMLLYESIQRSENMVVMAILLFIAVTVVIINMLTDIVLGLADPRVRRRLQTGRGA